MSMLEKSLTEFGLSLNEAKVYLAALELGQALASTLGKKTGINRSTVYMIIQSLKRKGFLGVFRKNGIDYFSAADPEIFSNKEEQIMIAQKYRMEKLSQLLIGLNDIKQIPYFTPKVQFFEGVDGIIRVYEDGLKDDVKEIFSFWGVDFIPEVIKNYLWNDYVPRRVKKGIPFYAIAPDLPLGKFIKKTEKEFLRSVVLIPVNKYPFDIEINLYANRISFMSYKQNELMGFLVESEAIFKTMKVIHQLCWDAAKIIEKAKPIDR